MSNVTPLNDPSNTPIERTAEWIAEKTSRGYLNANTGRFYQTALNQFAAILEPDEPRDIVSVLGKLDAIATRWSHKNPGNDGDTAKKYLKNARRALEWHRDFLQDPVGFQFDLTTRARKVSTDQASAADGKQKARGASAPNAAPPIPPAPIPPAAAHRYRLGQGREITFDLPDDFTIQEAFRFALHIVTHAVDFNPMDPDHVALVRGALVKS